MGNFFDDQKVVDTIQTDNLKNNLHPVVKVDQTGRKTALTTRKKPHPLITIQKTTRDQQVVKNFEHVKTPASLTDQLLLEITNGSWNTLDILKQWMTRQANPLPIDPTSLRNLVKDALYDKFDNRDIQTIVRDIIIAITKDEVDRLDHRFEIALTKVFMPLIKQRMPRETKVNGSFRHTITDQMKESQDVYDEVFTNNPELLEALIIEIEKEKEEKDDDNV